MPVTHPTEPRIRRVAGLVFLRGVVNTELDPLYNRLFNALYSLPSKTQVILVRSLMEVIGRISMVYWVREHDASYAVVSSGQMISAPHQGEKALYVGSGIYVKDPVDIDTFVPLGLKRADSAEQLRANFWNWMEETGWKSLPEAIRSADSPFLRVDAYRTLAHEYCHWWMTEGTTLATLVEAVSWRVTFGQMALSKLLEKEIGIPTALDSDGLQIMKERRDIIRSRIMEMSGESVVDELLVDLTNHHYYASIYYPTIMSCFLEPTAWLLVSEPNMSYSQLLRLYFGPPESDLHKRAQRILEKAGSHLSKNGTNGREGLVKAVRVAFDFPIKHSNELQDLLGTNSLGMREQLLDTIERRFVDYLDGKDVVCAREDESHFADAMIYSLWFRLNPKVGDPFVRELLHLAKQNPQTFARFRRKALTSMKEPTFKSESLTLNAQVRFANSREDDVRPQIVQLRYDNFLGVGLDSRGGAILEPLYEPSLGRTISRIEDLVGSIPPTISTALTILHELDRVYWSKMATVQESAEAWKKVDEIGLMLMQISANAYAEYCKLVRETLFPYVQSRLNLPDLILNKPGQTNDFLLFWFDLISSLGENMSWLASEHGMSA